LKVNTAIGESVAKLPTACVDSLTNSDQIKEVKQSALHAALLDLRNADKSRDDLLNKIESLEARQKKAYLSLYERVGGEINTRLTKTVAEYESEIRAQVERDRKLSATELEMTRLKGQQAVG
jgi:archaellum component FlaC